MSIIQTLDESTVLNRIAKALEKIASELETFRIIFEEAKELIGR